MLPSFGTYLLYLAFCAVVYVVGAAAFAYRIDANRRAAVLETVHRGSVVICVSLVGAFAVLITLFLNDDFTVNYIWAHSSKAQPTIFKISAAWGGQSGSLLMWATILSIYGMAVSKTGRKAGIEIAPTAVAVLHVVSLFFVGLVAFKENPFAALDGPLQADGRGLNPLLQNYWMQIHPPTLYTGYVGCTIPFALTMAALLHRRFDKDWLAFTRRWTLFPWLILIIGIVMGGAWAYETLGWGGYWAWDPVENASLMPWLTATAFLHSLIIQARRGMLKNWNVVLVTLTFLLSVFGTFLTRSGVVSSVHSFAESDIGPYFLTFLGFALIASFGLIILRRAELQGEVEFETLLSREGAFLMNNWILLGAAFTVLWGTVFPAVSEALGNQKVSVGAPYFNKVMVPLGLLLLALTGIGPLMAWRRTSTSALWKAFRMPLLVMLVASPGLWALSHWHTGAATSFCLCAFVTVAIGAEFVRGARARSSMTGEGFGESLVNLVLRNKQRYGGYIVHLGVVLMFVGLTGAAFNIETEPIKLRRGETMRIGEYTLRYVDLVRPHQTPREKLSEIHAKVEVLDGTRKVTELYPWVDTFKDQSQVAEEARAGQPPQQARRPEIMSNLAHDLYLVLSEYDEKTRTASIKAYLNPLVMWIWISTLFFIGGTAISMLPNRRRANSETAGSAVGGGEAGGETGGGEAHSAANGSAKAAPQSAKKPEAAVVAAKDVQ